MQNNNLSREFYGVPVLSFEIVRACTHCVFRMTLWPVHRDEIKCCLFRKSGFCFLIFNQ